MSRTNLATPPRGRKALLQATLRVVGLRGVEAVTHRSVAEEAGVSAGTATYHFASREEMLLAAFHDHVDWYQRDAPAIEAFRPKSVEKLVDFVMEIVRRDLKEHWRVRAEYELVLFCAKDAHLRRAYTTRVRNVIMMFAEPLEYLGCPRPLEAARTLCDLMRGFSIDWIANPELPIEELRDHYMNILPALVTPASSSRAEKASGASRIRRKRAAATGRR